MSDPRPLSGYQVGPWLRWFAWHPVKTADHGWRWLCPVWRSRWAKMHETPGVCYHEWWFHLVERGDSYLDGAA